MSDSVAAVLSEFSKPRDDFLIDLPIKVGGALLVGGTIGFATRRIVKMRTTVLYSAGVGTGLAIENYSNQLSAPYVTPATVKVDSKPLLLTQSALPLGAVWETVNSVMNPPPAPAKTTEEVQAPAPVEEEKEEEKPVESVVEAVLESVEEIVENVETEVAEAVEEVRETVAEIAEEVATVAETVAEVAGEVEAVANSVDEVVQSETVEKIAADAEEVVEIAQEVEKVAEEVAEATKE